jgi:hypothetical protein
MNDSYSNNLDTWDTENNEETSKIKGKTMSIVYHAWQGREPITAKAWDVVTCGNGHACMLVVRPFTLPGDLEFSFPAGPLPRNSSFLVIDGGPEITDGQHWGSFRCKTCGQHTLMDENGFRIIIRKYVDEEA